MKDIKIAESITRDAKGLKTTVKFTIGYFPDEKSLQMDLFERSFRITDLELTTTYASDMFEKMRLDNATTVFRDFYKKNLLN